MGKLDKDCPTARLLQRMRERRKGVKQISAAHRVSIGSKVEQSGSRRICAVDERNVGDAKSNDVQALLVGWRVSFGSREEADAVRVEGVNRCFAHASQSDGRPHG